MTAAPKFQYFEFIRDNLILPPTLGELVEIALPDVIEQASKFFAYVVSEDGKTANMRPIANGQRALFWDGTTMSVERFDYRTHVLNDYFALAYRISRLPPCRIIDIGAGTCFLSAALRHVGCTHPILSVDRNTAALEIGTSIAKTYGLQNCDFLCADIGWEWLVKGADIFSEFNDPPFFAVTKTSILSLYDSGGSYADLFQRLARDERFIGGMHLDLCGMNTQAYLRLSAQLPEFISNPAPIADFLRAIPNDPFSCIQRNRRFRITEHEEIWPHFFNCQYPSFLAWEKITP